MALASRQTMKTAPPHGSGAVFVGVMLDLELSAFNVKPPYTMVGEIVRTVIFFFDYQINGDEWHPLLRI